MDILVSKLDSDVMVLRPSTERLDLEVAPQFRAALLEHIQNGNRNIVVDLQDVSFIDSSGLGSLVSGLKLIKTSKDRRTRSRPDPPRRHSQRGDIRLANVQGSVAALLEIIRLDRVFASFSSVDEAVRSYRGPGGGRR